MAEVLHDWLNPGLEFDVFYYRLALATTDTILDAEINFLGMDDEVIDKDAFLCNLRDRRGRPIKRRRADTFAIARGSEEGEESGLLY